MKIAPGAQSWLSSEVQEPLVDVNLHCLELLRERVRGGELRLLPRVLGELAPLWASLGDEAIARAARVPYALVRSVFVATRGGGGTEVRDGGRDTVVFAGAECPELTREVVMLAWYLARLRRPAARLVLGLEPGMLEALAGCTLRGLERLAQTRTLELSLRWADRPLVWKHALTAALSGDEAALERARLRGIQLLAAEAWRQGRS
jgi:hypothetical protein